MRLDGSFQCLLQSLLQSSACRPLVRAVRAQAPPQRDGWTPQTATAGRSGGVCLAPPAVLPRPGAPLFLLSALGLRPPIFFKRTVRTKFTAFSASAFQHNGLRRSVFVPKIRRTYPLQLKAGGKRFFELYQQCVIVGFLGMHSLAAK